MCFFAAVELLVTSSANVLEGLARLEPVFVATFLLAAGVVKVHTYLVVSHIVLRNTIDVLLALGSGGLGLSAAAVVRLLPVREGVVLWHLLEP